MRDKILGWSASRYDCFSLCRRQYFYQYYGLKFTDFLTREKVAVLKKLVSGPLFVGQVAHDLIAKVLRRLQSNPEEIEKAKFFAYCDKIIEQSFKENSFLEEYYGQKHIKLEELKSDIHKVLEDFFATRWFSWIRESALENRKSWLVEPGDFGLCCVGGLKAYCKVDFAFPLGETIYVLDWKTGKSDEIKHRKQLLGYVHYVMEHYKVPAQAVKAGLAYVGRENRELETEFDSSEVEEFKTQLSRETDEMYRYCLDVQENVPLGIEHFTPCNKPNVCRQCNYQEVCLGGDTPPSSEEAEF